MRPGQCFHNVLEAVTRGIPLADGRRMAIASMGATVVHGRTRVGPHAWIEFGDAPHEFVWDYENGVVRKEDFYEAVNAIPEREYEPSDLIARCIREEHSGPFDGSMSENPFGRAPTTHERMGAAAHDKWASPPDPVREIVTELPASEVEARGRREQFGNIIEQIKQAARRGDQDEFHRLLRLALSIRPLSGVFVRDLKRMLYKHVGGMSPADRRRRRQQRNPGAIPLEDVIAHLCEYDGTGDEDFLADLEERMAPYPAWALGRIDPKRLNNYCSDEETCREYAEMGMSSSPAIIVVPADEPGRWDIIDGAHRAWAAEMTGRKVLAYYPQ